MKIDTLWISNYKNIINTTIDFDENSLSTILIGENGTAKSNLLEAIVHIFRDLDLKNDPLFEYKINYFIGDKYIQIDAKPDRVRNKVNILVNGDKISYNSLKNKEEDIYLPKNVFGYYSGINERFKDLFNKHKDNFYRQKIGRAHV